MSDRNRSMDFAHAIIQNMICPPPPRRIERLSRQELRELVVPKPDSLSPTDLPPSSLDKETKENEQSSSALERLLKNVDELSRYCRPMTVVLNNNTDEINTINQPPAPRVKALSNTQRIRKVIFELLETERSYVQVSHSYSMNVDEHVFQDMQRLLERYIEPLRDDAKLLPADAIESLYVSVKSIHQLQQTFLERLESNVPMEVVAYNAVQEFRVCHEYFYLFSISEDLLFHLGYSHRHIRYISFPCSIFQTIFHFLCNAFTYQSST